MSVLIGTRTRAALLCVSLACSGSIFGACGVNDSRPESSGAHLGGAKPELGEPAVGGMTTGGPLGAGGSAIGGQGGQFSAGGTSQDSTAGAAGGGTLSSGGAGGGGSGGTASGGSADAFGGATGGAGEGGAGGASETLYNPCPEDRACRIMPLGDSITYGAGSTDGGGYRVQIFRRAVTAAQAITFVGRSMSGPEIVSDKPFPMSHEGHSGYLIDDGPERPGLFPLVDEIFAAATPDIVLLMIGTNDIPWMLDLDNAPKRLGILIDRIISLAPDALVVVAQIGPTDEDERTALVQAYNEGIPAVVQERAAAGKHVKMVDMFTPFVENSNYKTELLSDEVHPSDAGHVILGNVWYEAIQALLPPAI